MSDDIDTMAIPSCPSWCILPPDHDMNDRASWDPNGVLSRTHSSVDWTAADATAEIYLLQTTVIGDPDDHGEAAPTVYVHTASDGLTVEQARTLARGLLATVDRVGPIAE